MRLQSEVTEYEEEKQDALKGPAENVYALAPYHDGSSCGDEYLDIYDR